MTAITQTDHAALRLSPGPRLRTAMVLAVRRSRPALVARRRQRLPQIQTARHHERSSTVVVIGGRGAQSNIL